VAQRLVVFLMLGGVAGFGAVFLQVPGIVLAAIVLAVVAGTGTRRPDPVRVGGYLLGVGIVGWSLVGPAVKGGGGYLFASGWVLVTAYAVVAVAGALLVAAAALAGLRGRPGGRARGGSAEPARQGGRPPSERDAP
jgi:hypothetical protein